MCPDPHRQCKKCLDCNYLSTAEVNNVFTNSTQSNYLSILHINIRSLSSNFLTLENMIFSNFDAYPDVLCITETKMNNSTDVDLMQLPGYKFIHNNSLSNAGGAGIYYSEKCKVIYRSDLDFNLGGEFEGIFIEIQPEKGAQKHLIIGSIYRHPHEIRMTFMKY